MILRMVTRVGGSLYFTAVITLLGLVFFFELIKLAILYVFERKTRGKGP